MSQKFFFDELKTSEKVNWYLNFNVELSYFYFFAILDPLKSEVLRKLKSKNRSMHSYPSGIFAIEAEI